MGCLNAAADCLDIRWLCVTSIYFEVTTGPMGTEGQGDGVRHPADSWAAFESHVVRMRTCKSQRVTVDCPMLSQRVPLARPWWMEGCSDCTSGLLATDIRWLWASDARLPPLPAPSHLPGIHSQLPGSSLLPLAFCRPHPGHTINRQEPTWPCCPGMLSWAVP